MLSRQWLIKDDKTHPGTINGASPASSGSEYFLLLCELIFISSLGLNHVPHIISSLNALLVKVVNRVFKCTKSGQKYKVVSHSINPPSYNCCMFWVGYDPHFVQKISDDVDVGYLGKIVANIKKNCCKIWGITYSKHAENITWWVYWMRNKCLLLATFWTFQNPIDHFNQ